MLCSHGVLSGVGSGVGSEILNTFNIPDPTPDPDPDIKCSHDGTVRRTVPSCENHIMHGMRSESRNKITASAAEIGRGHLLSW